MELISEEEISVCRSEGSPIKKKRKDADKKLKKKAVKIQDNAQAKRTLMQMYNEIKKINNDQPKNCEDDKSSSEASSCDQSYCSADDLAEDDLKMIHGGILEVINKFDQVFNHTESQKEKKKPPLADKDRIKEKKLKKKALPKENKEEREREKERPKEVSQQQQVQPF